MDLVTILGNLADVADKVGAFVLALAFIFLFLRGTLVLGASVAGDAADAARERAEQDEEHQRQIDYLEALRKQEREDRIAAETAMRSMVAKFDDVTALIQGLKEEVIRGGRRGT